MRRGRDPLRFYSRAKGLTDGAMSTEHSREALMSMIDSHVVVLSVILLKTAVSNVFKRSLSCLTSITGDVLRVSGT